MSDDWLQRYCKQGMESTFHLWGPKDEQQKCWDSKIKIYYNEDQIKA